MLLCLFTSTLTTNLTVVQLTPVFFDSLSQALAQALPLPLALPVAVPRYTAALLSLGSSCLTER